MPTSTTPTLSSLESSMTSMQATTRDLFDGWKAGPNRVYRRKPPLLLAQVALALISSLTLFLYMILLLVDEYVLVHNHENIVIPHDNGKNLLLLPQLKASFGLVHSCVAGTCKSRGDDVGIMGFLPLDQQTLLQSVAPSLATSYQQVVDQYVFGYDVAKSCGHSSDMIRSRSVFVMVAIVFGLVFQVVAMVLSVYLFGGLSHLYRRDEIETLDHPLGPTREVENAQTSTEMEERVPSSSQRHRSGSRPANPLASSITSSSSSSTSSTECDCPTQRSIMLREERLIIYMVALMAALSFVFTLMAMAVEVAMVTSTMKCGHGVCNVFRSSMNGLLREMESIYKEKGTNMPNYHATCSVGSSYVLLILAMVMSLMVLALCALVWLLHHRFGAETCTRYVGAEEEEEPEHPPPPRVDVATQFPSTSMDLASSDLVDSSTEKGGVETSGHLGPLDGRQLSNTFTPEIDKVHSVGPLSSTPSAPFHGADAGQRKSLDLVEQQSSVQGNMFYHNSSAELRENHTHHVPSAGHS